MKGTILERIIKQKEIDVAKMKELDLSPLQNDDVVNLSSSLYESFINSDHLNVIAEIKRASPSKGNININLNIVEQARRYEANGAKAISVLTDPTFFKGSIDDLKAIRKAVSVPILCKDFIIDEIQIDLAKAAGANIILLIAASLSPNRLIELFNYAKDSGLEILFEIHNEKELEIAQHIGARIIGINNRDLKTFHVDLTTTEKLASKMTNEDTVVISESGIHLREDAERVAKAGVHGILVGEALMRSENVGKTLKSLQVSKEKTIFKG